MASTRDIIPNYYPTEVERYTVGCLLDDMVTLDYGDIDSRYQFLENISVTEYDVQYSSGVLDIIFSQKDASEHVSLDYKKVSMYNFWFRSTIDYDINCIETQGMTVQDYLDLINEFDLILAEELNQKAVKLTFIMMAVTGILSVALF